MHTWRTSHAFYIQLASVKSSTWVKKTIYNKELFLDSPDRCVLVVSSADCFIDCRLFCFSLIFLAHSGWRWCRRWRYARLRVFVHVASLQPVRSISVRQLRIQRRYRRTPHQVTGHIDSIEVCPDHQRMADARRLPTTRMTRFELKRRQELLILKMMMMMMMWQRIPQVQDPLYHWFLRKTKPRYFFSCIENIVEFMKTTGIWCEIMNVFQVVERECIT